MITRPTDVDDAIKFVWKQPDTNLTSSEKQSLNAILAHKKVLSLQDTFLLHSQKIGLTLSRHCLNQQVFPSVQLGLPALS